ncbi:hypothetical protein LTR29_015209, partial [Friedmanniomyces endolithicus]
LRDAVGAIADELVQDAGDEGEGFGVVEAEAAGEAALGEGADLGYQEFVDLVVAGWGVSMLGVEGAGGGDGVSLTSLGDSCIVGGVLGCGQQGMETVR